MDNLNTIIKPLEGFQYSVNIAYDIYDDKKIKSYIPSNSSLSIIEDILSSVDPKSNDRARILTGAYGKGKSHLILCVLALLAGRSKDLFSTLIKKAEEVNPILAKNICSYLDSDKKLLPVIVNANSMDIKSTLLQSLSFALKQAGLDDLMPTTFFDVAISKINTWKTEFPETYAAFENKVGQAGEEFIRELQVYNQATYDLFVKIYPSLTSGSEFNPMAGSDVIGVFESVIDALKDRGYNGAFVVYDEFGKFLEGSVDKSSAMDIKIVQDFAEKCNRSGNKQIHLMLISHKSIENYIGKLSKEKVDAWKAVSNRFKSISINNEENEIYDMVSTVLDRNEEKFSRYVFDNQLYFDKLKVTVDKDHSFETVRSIMGDKVALSCYPLHPYSLLLLPKISELVAQNERTIFTFLSSTERFSVPYFLRTQNMTFPIIEPDYIYDYFEKLFRGEPFGSEIKRQWQIATNALSKLKEYDNELAEKIVKTIALIYCVNDFEQIPPSWDIIADIYNVQHSYAEIQSAKEVLKNSHLLIELLYRPYVRITEGSGHDVLGLIKEEAYRLENKVLPQSVLNDINEVKYLYPVQYNDENEIIRYYDFKFIDYTELNGIDREGYKIESNADGIIYSIIVKDEIQRLQAENLLSQISNPRIICFLPKESNDLTSICVEYSAIESLLNQYKDKEANLIDELSYIKEDRASVIKSYIENTFLRPEKQLSSIYYKSNIQDIKRKAQLSNLLSQVVNEIYSKTPKVVNDLINKNVLSGAIRNARTKIISAILAGNYEKDLGFLGNGPELNILRGTLVLPGIFINNDAPYFQYSECDERFAALLNEIDDFILSTVDCGKSFSLLYDVLISPEYGYGLKRGLIPIYLAVIFSKYKSHLVIQRKDKELILTAQLLSEIENRPQDYSLMLEAWDDSKEAYVSILESIFSSYINPSDRQVDSFTCIVKAMRRWYLQLSKYESTTRVYCDEKGNISSLEKDVIKFRNLLANPEINAHSILFDKLLKCFSTNSFDIVIKGVRKAYLKLSSTYQHQQRRLISNVKKLFGVNEKESLSSSIANFYDDLSQQTREHLFSGKIAVFLNIAKHPHNDEYRLIEDVARAIFNLRMGDFTDDIMESFIPELETVKNQILQYNSDIKNNPNTVTGFRIAFTDKNGEDIVRQFDSAEYSQNGEYFYNALTDLLEEFGESISSDEKRQILFDILKELV